MKLTDLIKNVGEMTEEQLREHVESIRHNKYVAKPAVKKREADVEKKEQNTKIRSVDKQLAEMTTDQKAALLKQLMGDAG